MQLLESSKTHSNSQQAGERQGIPSEAPTLNKDNNAGCMAYTLAHLGDTKTDLNAVINTLRAELEQTRLNVRHVAEASKASTVSQNIPSSAPKN